MAKVFLQFSYVCTNGPISFCIPEGILTQIFTWDGGSNDVTQVKYRKKVRIGQCLQVFSNHKKSVALYDTGVKPLTGQLLNSFQFDLRRNSWTQPINSEL